MKIIVVGCGKVGSALTRQLSEEGHDVSVIDVNQQVVNEVSSSCDVIGVVGNGGSHAVQKEVGVEDADLMIAASDSDELNLLCCLIAKKAGNCSTIARVRSPIYNSEIGFIREELGLSLAVNPEYAAAIEASRLLKFPSAIKIEPFARGHIELLKFPVIEGSALNGRTLAEISGSARGDVLVCAVERGPNHDVTIPDGSFRLQTGDTISVVASGKNARSFVEKVGLKSRSVANCMIIGGGTICFYLAKILLESNIRVTIIDKDPRRCKMLSDELPEANVICGDAANQNVLLEEGIENCESFVSLTGMDEENIFLSLYARRASKKDVKLITKINRINYDDIIGDMNLGSILNPQHIVAEYIVRYVRAMENSIGSNVETLYNIIEGKAEALEFLIQAGSPVIGIPLSRLPLKKGVLVACIYRNHQVIIPNGQTMIEVDDRVIIVTKQIGFQDVRDILQDAHTVPGQR
ncbi:MAG: Trk system potassium transporter TrkA [Lachnospiraceae bacterium]|nr:Trk system potassium transporter TrkA [Lachnospiraceae bacterium]MDO4408796.1 Trk system potassium transporter TrkA [Eubacteriales bacterium]